MMTTSVSQDHYSDFIAIRFKFEMLIQSNSVAFQTLMVSYG